MKGKLVLKLLRQSDNWMKTSVWMARMKHFEMDMKNGNKMTSWDIKGGYLNFCIHTDMRDLLLFLYGGNYYRCETTA